jgi:minor curlin subunit
MGRFLSSKAAAVSASLMLFVAGMTPGSAQDADMPQIDAVPGGISTVLQNGNRNDASVNQLAVQSGMAPGQNQALITQNGDDNKASITQQGDTNSATIAQNGSNNEGAIVQMNSGNNFELQQSGNGLSIKIEQYGASIPGNAPVMITQGN